MGRFRYRFYTLIKMHCKWFSGGARWFNYGQTTTQVNNLPVQQTLCQSVRIVLKFGCRSMGLPRGTRDEATWVCTCIMVFIKSQAPWPVNCGTPWGYSSYRLLTKLLTRELSEATIGLLHPSYSTVFKNIQGTSTSKSKYYTEVGASLLGSL